MDILFGDKPLILDVRQSGSVPPPEPRAGENPRPSRHLVRTDRSVAAGCHRWRLARCRL